MEPKLIVAVFVLAINLPLVWFVLTFDKKIDRSRLTPEQLKSLPEKIAKAKKMGLGLIGMNLIIAFFAWNMV